MSFEVVRQQGNGPAIADPRRSEQGLAVVDHPHPNVDPGVERRPLDLRMGLGNLLLDERIEAGGVGRRQRFKPLGPGEPGGA